jgi:hypothetical protein
MTWDKYMESGFSGNVRNTTGARQLCVPLFNFNSASKIRCLFDLSLTSVLQLEIWFKAFFRFLSRRLTHGVLKVIHHVSITWFAREIGW